MVNRLQALATKLKNLLDPNIGSLNTNILDVSQLTELLKKANTQLGHSKVIAYEPSKQYNSGTAPLVRTFHEAETDDESDTVVVHCFFRTKNFFKSQIPFQLGIENSAFIQIRA